MQHTRSETDSLIPLFRYPGFPTQTLPSSACNGDVLFKSWNLREPGMFYWFCVMQVDETQYLFADHKSKYDTKFVWYGSSHTLLVMPKSRPPTFATDVKVYLFDSSLRATTNPNKKSEKRW